MYAVLGATGQVGGAVARTLAEHGHQVRAVLRDAGKAAGVRMAGHQVAVADAYDADALVAAFAGVDGAFVMNPPSYASPDMFADSERVAEAIGRAAARAGVPQLVCLSSVGAHRPQRQGNIRTTRILEQALSALPIPVAFVRAAWFMENWAGTVEAARQNGVVPSFLQPLDRAIPMVATADIGRVCAEVLIEHGAGRRIVELEGPRDYAPEDVAAAIGAILNKRVKATAVPREGWAVFFESKGNSPAAALAWVEVIDSFNDGWMSFEGGHKRRRGRVEMIDVLERATVTSPTPHDKD